MKPVNQQGAKPVDMNDGSQSRKVSAVNSRRFEYVFLFGLFCILSLCGAITYRSFQVMHNERELIELGAAYRWDTESMDRKSSNVIRPIQRSLAEYFGKPLVANFSSVQLTRGNPSDGQLSILSRLTSLESLELKSDRATDQTLGLISSLPDLRYLSLAGSRFSVLGLLQLRNSRQLCQLEIDTQSLTPVELAVLRSELPGVLLRDVNASSDVEHRPNIATLPAA